MKILAVSGSLRAASRNSALLRAVARMAPADLRVEVYDGLGALPLFNPDLEASNPSEPARLYRAILEADALLIASPEYAHGITGAMKNALDWMVGNESFMNKPVALINASSRAVHAHAALRETLSTMAAHLIDEACITVPLLGSAVTEEEIPQHALIGPALTAMLEAIRRDVESHRRLDSPAFPIDMRTNPR